MGFDSPLIGSFRATSEPSSETTSRPPVLAEVQAVSQAATAQLGQLRDAERRSAEADARARELDARAKASRRPPHRSRGDPMDQGWGVSAPAF